MTCGNIKNVKVLIGQVCLTKPPNILESVLGSCIGLVMYDKIVGLAGMAHILLPEANGRVAEGLPGKYADHAVVCLKRALVERGAHAERLKAKYSGGAKMFNSHKLGPVKDIGASNAEAVRVYLRQHGIPVVSSDIGGNVGRRVSFNIESLEYTIEDFAQSQKVI